MLYYKKDKKVRLLKHCDYLNATGSNSVKYKYLTGDIWAYTKQLSQKQMLDAQAFGTDETRLFVLNYREDLDVYDLIEYKGSFHRITRLDTTDDYKGELYVYTNDLPRGKVLIEED